MDFNGILAGRCDGVEWKSSGTRLYFSAVDSQLPRLWSSAKRISISKQSSEQLS